MNRLPERIAKRVEQAGDCLNWTGGRNNRGYGSLGIGNKRTALVHRFVYEQVIGPIPEGMTIDHLCMNKVCVNVDHLEVVTRSENSKRAARARNPLLYATRPTTGGFSDIVEKFFGHRLKKSA